MGDPFADLRAREGNEADRLALSASAAGASALQASTLAVATLAVSRAMADGRRGEISEPAADMREIRTSTPLLEALGKDLVRAAQVCEADLLAALQAGYVTDSHGRAAATMEQAKGLVLRVDLTEQEIEDLASFPIMGHTAAETARHLVVLLNNAVQGALAQPLTGALDVSLLPAALGEVARTHGDRLGNAVREAYFAGAQAAEKALRAALIGGAGSAPGASGAGGWGMIRLDISGNATDLRPDQQKAIEQGGFSGDEVWVEFLTQRDNRVRPAHAALHGTFWRVDDPLAPTPPLDYGCFLPGTMVEGFFDGASRALYTGKAVEILTKGGLRLRVTPNHPIPTEQGVVPAGSLQPGRKLGRYRPFNRVLAAGEGVDEEHKPARVEDVFHALAKHRGIALARNTGHEFHGDAQAIDGEIEIVGSYRVLWGMWEAESGQQIRQLALPLGHEAIPTPGLSLGEHRGPAGLPTTELDAGNGVRRGDLHGSFLNAHARPFESFRLGLAAQLDALGQQAAFDCPPSDAETLGYRIDGLPLLVRRDQSGGIDWRQMQCLRLGQGPHLDTCLYQPDADGLGLNPVFLANLARAHPAVVELDDVVEVRWFDYSGHVYDLRSPCGYVIADGAFASNCRCQLRYVAKPGSQAAQVFPVANGEPVSVAVTYAEYLTKHLPKWKQVAKAARQAEPAQMFRAAFLKLKEIYPNIGQDGRDLARMAAVADLGSLRLEDILDDLLPPAPEG